MLQQEQQQAQATLERSLRTQTQGDMASLMARYGSQLALAQTGGIGMAPMTGGSMTSRGS
jgi:hypothetical protein